MGSPDLPEDTVDAATVAPGTPAQPPRISLPPVDLPVYQPRSRSMVWSFLWAFALATALSAVAAWLLLR